MDAPLDNWPESTPKSWDVMELLGVKGIDARWLNTKAAEDADAEEEERQVTKIHLE